MASTLIEYPAPSASVLDALEGELRWLSLRLSVVIDAGRRQRSVGPPAEYRGLYVTDEEIDVLLSDEEAEEAPPERRIARAARVRADLDSRRDSLRDLPLEHVAREFGLRPEERLVLLTALAPYVDSAYEKVYAYANDDITKRWPTVGLTLQVLSDDPLERVALRRLFYLDAPLSRHQLLASAEPASPAPPLLSRQISLDPHLAETLLGYRGLDPRLLAYARWQEPRAGGGQQEEALARVLHHRLNARVYLGGRWQTDKEDAIAGACGRAGLGLISVKTQAVLRSAEPASILALILRDARLLRSAVLFQDWGAQESESPESSVFAAEAALKLQDHPLPVFFSDRASSPPRLPANLHLQFEFPAPSFEERQRLWTAASEVSAEDASHLAAMYRLGRREIDSAWEMARSLASFRGDDGVVLEDLKVAARMQSQPRLTSLAQKIVPRFTWEDIVLPPDRMAQLREIANQVLYQHVVYEEWGLAAKSSLGRGVAALFAGQSGTGKTMAAEIIGSELGLEVYKIDLAGLVSKYIGETEKNLARVFEEASDTNAILFFDEADAVFGKRSEVRDSHDRYANIEVSYLLQRMEEYDGIVVLATNLRSNLDDAFLRRMRAIVEFPFPEADDRLRIWQRTLASSAPMADDVDLSFMARQFRIAGGNIRNIVVLAAFLAASTGEPIGMNHLIQATKREYQKLGRLVTESDFGRWYEEVRA
ncbi:MAG TPA: ATP-binding protein [Dehalococcoidia bacterium]|nr:ATP-binding protein [Dehalococcoidia bacterium]